MREIKFRAWDKETKTMCYMNHPHWSLTFGHNGIAEVYNLQNGSGGNDYELMQFTGLKDKNGKEIYEKDILKESAPRGYKDFVSFSNGSFGMDNIITSLSQHTIDGLGFEIIGNLYENPELLEEK